MPPIIEPARLRRFMIKANTSGASCGVAGAPTSVIVPSRLSSAKRCAIGAVLATVDDAAYADQLSQPEPQYVGAHLGHAAHDLVARHAGRQRASPFRAHLMQVGMAYTAIGDFDLHVMRARGAARDIHGFERTLGR